MIKNAVAAGFLTGEVIIKTVKDQRDNSLGHGSPMTLRDVPCRLSSLLKQTQGYRSAVTKRSARAVYGSQETKRSFCHDLILLKRIRCKKKIIRIFSLAKRYDFNTKTRRRRSDAGVTCPT